MATLATQRTHSSPANRMDPEGRRTSFDKIYLGFVREIQDSMFMGRIKVWVPELCGPDLPTTHIICDYVTPFGGSQGRTSYGMWAIPRVGAQAIITFINGDPNRAVYLGCLYDVDQHAQVPNAPTQGGSTSIEERDLTVAPNYSDPRPACQAAPAIGVAAPQRPTNPTDPALTAQQTGDGTNRSVETRPTGFSSNNSYNVMGIRTPSGSHITLSDQQGAAEIRLATFNGMQIIMNAQSGTITILGRGAQSRIELTSAGNVNVYGKGSISIAAEENLNLHANKNVNIQAGEKLNVRSVGNTHWESVQEIHIKSNKNMFLTSLGEHHRASNGHIFDTTAQTMFRHANYTIRDSVVKGDINFKCFEGSLKATVKSGKVEVKADQGINMQTTAGPINIRANTDLEMAGLQNVHLRSLQGKFNITAETNLNLRANTGTMLLTNIAGVLQLKATGGVFVDPAFNINTGAGQTAEQALLAQESLESIGSLKADAAKSPQVVEHPSQGNVPASGADGDVVGTSVTRSNSVITSVASYVPAGETSANRYQSGPGFTNTDTIEPEEECTKDYKVGQVEFNQLVPLSVWGYVNGASTPKPLRFIGEGYEENGKPRYRQEDIPEFIMKAASEYSGDYDGLSEAAFNLIRMFETLTGPWPSDRRLQPFQNACASASDDAHEPPSGQGGWIGYGHKLTAEEVANQSITIEGNSISFGNLTEEWFTKLLKQDLKPVCAAVKEAVGANLVTQQQLDALIDFAWNVGTRKFTESGVAGLISGKKYDEVPNQIIKWTRACGAIRAPLLSRRLYNCYTWSGNQRADSAVVLGPASGDGTRGDPNIRTSPGVEIAYNELRRLGYSPAAASGIVGNLWAESRMNVNAYNRGEDARGLAQWRFDRVVDVNSFLARTYGTQLPQGSAGGNTATIAQQVNGVHYEMTQGRDGGARRAGSLLRNNGALTSAEASDIFNRYFERSASSRNLNSPNNQWRRNDSQAVFDRFQGR